MIDLGGLMLFGVAGYLFLLARYDITPREAGYRIMRRITGSPMPIGINKSPYYRKRSPDGKMHRPILLNVETSEKSGQASHPDVIYIKEGFGSGRWNYWMVCTPYPNENFKMENPEIFVSRDGVVWEIPDRVQNPIENSPPMPRDHNSDPDMVYHDQKLWIYFREVIRQRNFCANRIMLMQSSDGIKWSAPLEVLRNKPGTEILSPSVVWHENAFFMWTVEKQDNQFRLIRRRSHNGANWDAPVSGNVIGLPKDRHLWHIDVIPENDRLSALMVTTIENGGRMARLHYSFSTDGGKTWFLGPFLLEQIYDFESKCQYRATFRKTSENPPLYEVWYSAANMKSVWSIAYVQCVRDENALFPR